ncbi:hypothetical protein COLO4_14815 [Corchorus olitorius]|uniref:Uncharacterized protein n=1 Tax=Corchorus olitorius TaxID=93759 RepID=A0A1R3JQP1_9ROSI|nr:hypothetical protein COLO4_14815 [Corchorus olitorius]
MDEFEKCVGYSPVVKELMRRENVDRMNGNDPNNERKINSYFSKSLRGSKRRGAAMLKSIKGVANSMHLRGEKERDFAADQKGGKKENNQWVKVTQKGKSYKELSALHLCQEIQAHEGSIWTIKFSTDARFLASAGEDKVIQVWEVQECEVMSMSEGSLTPLHPSLTSSPIHPSLSMSNQDQSGVLDAASNNLQEKKKKGKGSASKKGNPIPDYVHVPESVFSLSDRPICSFKGHLDDVLDLSWSRSQKVPKKMTGFQFCPSNPSEVLVTSADSRIRILDGSEGHIYVPWSSGFRNTSSQIAASFTSDGKYVISASEDSQVFVWRREEPRNTGTGKRSVITARGHEHFPCKDVSVAITWPEEEVAQVSSTDTGTTGEPPTISNSPSIKQGDSPSISSASNLSSSASIRAGDSASSSISSNTNPDEIRTEDSTPLATVDDIQKRLLRPPSLHSPPEGLSSLQLKVNLKQSGTVKKKLEDYLDPVILAAVSSKIGRSKKAKTETKLKREVRGFEWPVDELKVFVEEDSTIASYRARSSRNSEAVVELNNDFDVIGDGGDEGEEIGSPFQRLEEMALKKFKL